MILIGCYKVILISDWLTDLLRALWGILLSYHQLFTWHTVKWSQQGDELRFVVNNVVLDFNDSADSTVSVPAASITRTSWRVVCREYGRMFSPR